MCCHGEIAASKGRYVVVLKLHECDDGRLLSTATARGQTSSPHRSAARAWDGPGQGERRRPHPYRRKRYAAPSACRRGAGREPERRDALWPSSRASCKSPGRAAAVVDGACCAHRRDGGSLADDATERLLRGMPTDRDLPYVPTDVSRDMTILVQSANAMPLRGYDSRGEPRRGSRRGKSRSPECRVRAYRSMPEPADASPCCGASAGHSCVRRAWHGPTQRASRAGSAAAEPKKGVQPPVAAVRAAAAAVAGGESRPAVASVAVAFAAITVWVPAKLIGAVRLSSATVAESPACTCPCTARHRGKPPSHTPRPGRCPPRHRPGPVNGPFGAPRVHPLAP